MSAVAEFEKYFLSGNAIPVERATIPADLARQVIAELAAATAQTLEAVGQLQAAQLRIAELSDLPEEVSQLRTAIHHYEAEVKRLVARAESAERDALQRAADAIQGRISAHPLGSTAMVEAHKCQSAILALIPKERT